MNALNTLYTARKVLYLGISDTPAWLVVKANDYARQHGLRPFSIYQGRWSAACRDFEREIIPMCIDQGMALAPWGVLGGGAFKSNNESKEGRNTGIGRTGKEERVRDVLEAIGKEKGTNGPSVALAYVMHKAPYVFPIVGGRKITHLQSNVEALGLRLSSEDMDTIDNAYEWEIGFPHDFVTSKNKMVVGPEDNAVNGRQGFFDHVQNIKPIVPHEGPLEGGRAKPIGE
jgi:aryl-alcohol dehydrogenase-like predicted oxidoreductase